MSAMKFFQVVEQRGPRGDRAEKHVAFFKSREAAMARAERQTTGNLDGEIVVFECRTGDFAYRNEEWRRQRGTNPGDRHESSALLTPEVSSALMRIAEGFEFGEARAVENGVRRAVLHDALVQAWRLATQHRSEQTKGK